MNRFYLNNNIYENNSDVLLNLVHSIKQNKQFQESLIPIWALFTKTFCGEINKEDFKKYLAVLNKLLIPHIPASQLMELATEECNKFTKNDVPTINYDIFVEMFADIAFKWIDTPSIRQLTKFIDMILERTTKIVAINVMDE